jgi:hypothetical protein
MAMETGEKTTKVDMPKKHNNTMEKLHMQERYKTPQQSM